MENEIRELLRQAFDAVVAAERAKIKLFDAVDESESPHVDKATEEINRYLDVSHAGDIVVTLFDIDADDIIETLFPND